MPEQTHEEWVDARAAHDAKQNAEVGSIYISAESVAGATFATTEQWVCSPMIRRVGFCGQEKLQQLWSESFSGKQEWRDVPLHIETEVA